MRIDGHCPVYERDFKEPPLAKQAMYINVQKMPILAPESNRHEEKLSKEGER